MSRITRVDRARRAAGSRLGDRSNRSNATSTGWPTRSRSDSSASSSAGSATKFVCDTKVGPFTLTDEMEITEWEPGRSMGVRHSGIVTGSGVFTLEPIDLGRRTRFTWEEDLRFPWYVGGPDRRVGRWAGGAPHGSGGATCAPSSASSGRGRAVDRRCAQRRSSLRSAELSDHRGHGGAEHDHDDQRRSTPRRQRGGRDTCRAGVDHQVLAVGERAVHDERRDQRGRDQARDTVRAGPGAGGGRSRSVRPP